MNTENKNYKRELWEMISTKDPALKKLLEDIKRTTGKPQVNYVRFLEKP